MPHKKSEKIKTIKVLNKPAHPHSKKVKRSNSRKTHIESGALLNSELSNDSLTHGHSPYHHIPTEERHNKLDDRSQRLIMYIGISFIMVVIVFFWIMNLRQILGPDAFSMTASTDTQAKTDFENLKNDLTKTLSEVQGEIKNLENLSKEIPTTSANPALISGTATPNLISDTATPSLVSPIASPNLPKTLPN